MARLSLLSTLRYSSLTNLHLFILLLVSLQTTLAYDTKTCCELAVSKNALLEPIPTEPICGQSYSPETPGAPDIWVDYAFCKSECKGISLSSKSKPSQWAAPLVQFILPSVIFSMTIPRRKKIEFDYLFEFKWPGNLTRHVWLNEAVQLLVSMICFVVILIPVFVDTVLWIAVIVVGAGNMLMGGLYEAHLDYRILGYIKTLSDVTNREKLTMKTELLVAVACGNLELDREGGCPQRSIVRSITIPGPEVPANGHEKSRARLLNLVGAQSSFGGAVGSPVIFYLGAFVYTILDLLNDKSDQESSNALGFGIEWMIIVHVAIVSGCLLAANNPSTSAGIVGSGHEALEYRPRTLRRAPSISSNTRVDSKLSGSENWDWKRVRNQLLGWKNTYATEFQPVSLWERGRNKMEWIKRSKAYTSNHQDFRAAMHITWWGWIFKILMPAMMLIVLPPATGGVVAYFTPPRGVGCRALSFIVYAVCQVMTTNLALVRCAVDDGERGKRLQYWFTGWRFNAISSIFWFGALLAAVGGTTMQIVGVYRNCICYAGARSWYNVDRDNPMINLATDTVDAREASIFWIWMGSTATVFMGLTCYVGWWYQRIIRRRFVDAVKEMYIPEDISDSSVRGSVDDGALLSPQGEELRSIYSARSPLLPADVDARTWGVQTAKALVESRDREVSPMERGSVDRGYYNRISYDDRGDEIPLSPLTSPLSIPRKPVSAEYRQM